MTVEEYYAEIKGMNLTGPARGLPTIFKDRHDNVIRVPVPAGMTSEQMIETLEKIRENVKMYDPN